MRIEIMPEILAQLGALESGKHFSGQFKTIRALLSAYDEMNRNQVQAIQHQQAKLQESQARVAQLEEALRSVRESMEVARQVFPKGSLARGGFEGAFLRVDAEIDAALSASPSPVVEVVKAGMQAFGPDAEMQVSLVSNGQVNTQANIIMPMEHYARFRNAAFLLRRRQPGVWGS